MSNTKTVMSQAANTLVKPLEVEDVFSTYLYTGNGSTQTITNGIDLYGEGGLVWTKARSNAMSHALFDTERGAGALLQSDVTLGQYAGGTDLSSFNSNGFTLGASTFTSLNYSPYTYASWTFRKAPKFFDVVTYTGNTVAGRLVPHNLGSVPACIMIKRLETDEGWFVYHRGMDATAPENYYLQLNTTAARVDGTIWNDTAPTSTDFVLDADSAVNGSGETYVAYLFAHNDGDGGFGPDGDADIIKCGSYTGNNGSAHHVELGWEPQWLLVKNADLSTGGTWWSVVDVQRGMLANTRIKVLKANESEAEINENGFTPTATGFTVSGNNDFQNNSTNTYIYIAIRRGTKVPESATEVFAIDNQTASSAPFLTSNFPVDMVIRKRTTGGNSEVMSRLTQGKALFANATSSEQTDSVAQFDFNDGCLDDTSTDAARYGWMWKRAPGYFDAVAYSGSIPLGQAGSSDVSHNLGVAPEMMWVKVRDATNSWAVYHSAVGPTKFLTLDTTGTPIEASTRWNDTAPTSSVFTLGNNAVVNQSGNDYIAYLFASLPGISKVGSYTGNGTSQTIDCGFTSGARFVLIKNASESDNWYVFDTERGIVSGADPYLRLNLTLAEQSEDFIDPASSGFSVSGSDPGNNKTGNTYIFYAIA